MLISGVSDRFACACYRRNSNFIRVPTTVIGLIDASVSIKVAVNYGRYKNRLVRYSDYRITTAVELDSKLAHSPLLQAEMNLSCDIALATC